MIKNILNIEKYILNNKIKRLNVKKTDYKLQILLKNNYFLCASVYYLKYFLNTLYAWKIASAIKNKGITTGTKYFEKEKVIWEKESNRNIAVSIPKKVPTKVPKI